jgi:hypothetical protein
MRPDALARPHPSRFDPARADHAAALAAHAAAVEAGDAGYLDPTSGLFVLTAAFLAERGWCCDNGCRHCPYVGATEPRPASPLQRPGSSSA